MAGLLPNLNGTAVTYAYDSDGLRTKKTVDGVQYDYYYVDGQLRYERKGSDYELYYRYGLDGNLVSVTRYNLTSSQTETYYAITNIFGDVIELRSDSGDVYAKYVYDSWGKLVSIKASNGIAEITDSSNIAVQNSIRYRGYVYDTESGLYYLQSRYYDPETGRFLNADDVDFIGSSGTVLGYNAFAYCENNAVNNVDPSGYIAFTLINCMLIGIGVGAIVGIIRGTYYGYRNGLRGWKLVGNAIKNGIYWAANGAFMGSAIYALYGVISAIYKGCVFAITKTSATSATVSVLKRLSNQAITVALSDKSRLNHAFKHIGKSVTGQNWNYTTTLSKWESWIKYGLKNYTAMFAHKLGGESVTGYYICRDGKNYAIYIYTSGNYKGLVATVVELTKKQMEKFGLW